mgnify:CR=1 FL=1
MHCNVDNCFKPKYSYGFCVAHFYVFKHKRARGQCELCDEIGYDDGLCLLHYRLKNKKPKKCGIDGCERKYRRSGYCYSHFNQLLVSGKVCIRKISKNIGLCIIPKCVMKSYAKNYCQKHYNEQYKANKKINDICKINNCEDLVLCKGLCKFHYGRQYFGGDMVAPKRVLDGQQGCKFENCQSKHHAYGYCRIHYLRLYGSSWNSDPLLRIHVANVKKRDDNRCKWYGCDLSIFDDVEIHVNHIFPQSEYPELKYIEEYMICYCQSHHQLWHQARGDSHAAAVLRGNRRKVRGHIQNCK